MSIYKFFNSKNSMKRKILHIEEGIKKILSSICKEKFWIERYGEYQIDPKFLVIWICVESDREKESLKSNTKLIRAIRNLLKEYDYPEEARNQVHIDFESQESVDRESDGDWFLHFK